MKKTFIILILLVIISCNRENPTGNEILEPIAKDTLSREIADGIFLFVDSLKDVYSLNEHILTNVHLINETNISGLPISIENFSSFFSCRIKNSVGEIVNIGPLDPIADYNDTLRSGEEIVEYFRWSHFIYDENQMLNGLKAFTGNYILEIDFLGNNISNNPHLIKYFKISESGDPLSYHLFYDNYATDSINIDFVIRNRTKNQVELKTSNDLCRIFLIDNIYYQTPDTVFTQKIFLDKSVYRLAATSDNILYKLNYSKKDFVNQGITGSFYIVIKLSFVERIIVASKPLFIM